MSIVTLYFQETNRHKMRKAVELCYNSEVDSGGAGEIRTRDLFRAREALSQLSHSPTVDDYYISRCYCGQPIQITAGFYCVLFNTFHILHYWRNMAQTIRIRQMKPADICRVIEIERESFSDPWSESAYLTEISNGSAYYVVICIDDIIAGFAGMWVIMDEAHITTLAVEKQSRKMHLGERLLIDLLEESAGRGAKRATLEVRQSNIAAQNLYVKYEFKPVAIRREYYTNNNENAVIMWVDDIVSHEFRLRLSALKQQAQSTTIERMEIMD